jgi:hypothetical protein
MPKNELGPYQFFTQKQWDASRTGRLLDHVGNYLVVLGDKEGYNSLSGEIEKDEQKYACFHLRVKKNHLVRYFSAPDILQCLIDKNADLDKYDSIFLVDAPHSLIKTAAPVLQKDFYVLVRIAYRALWRAKAKQ